MKRINHEEAYSRDRACTNWAESYFSRLRRGEMGHHYHVAGLYLLRYTQEASWREYNRRAANGEQTQRVAPPDSGRYWIKAEGNVNWPCHSSRAWISAGYWQRHMTAAS